MLRAVICAGETISVRLDRIVKGTKAVGGRRTTEEAEVIPSQAVLILGVEPPSTQSPALNEDKECWADAMPCE